MFVFLFFRKGETAFMQLENLKCYYFTFITSNLQRESEDFELRTYFPFNLNPFQV